MFHETNQQIDCGLSSATAILKLEKAFSFELLVSAMANHKLPFRLRAGFTRLLLRLYVDRYPQQHIQMPRLIHVLKEVGRDSSGAPVVIEKGRKGVIHADDEKALPYFELDKSNKYVQSWHRAGTHTHT